MFYNTGIATYVWVITNRKPAHRQGHVQLIDATKWSTPLRRNLGQKNCELSEADIKHITNTFMAFEQTEQSKIFPNAAFRLLEGNRGAPAADSRHRPRAGLQSPRNPETSQRRPARRKRRTHYQENPCYGHGTRPPTRSGRHHHQRETSGHRV